jgi:hypothetical protein
MITNPLQLNLVRTLALTATLVLAGFVIAQTQRIRQAQVYNAITAIEIGKVLDGQKYKYKIGKDDQGDPQIKLTINGVEPVYIDFYDCKTDGCSSVLITYGIDLDDGTTLEKVNTWNSDNRFSRVFRDEENDPFIESDLDLRGGVTIDNVQQWLKTFVSSLNDFSDTF